MILDARKIESGTTLESDVCIIGGGPTGIILAREFVKQDFSVMMLESGRGKFFHPAQWLNIGKNIGRPYFDITFTRHRMLGGSTKYWFGLCLPLAPIDFEARDWLPNSGWPFGIEELNPFYRRACEVFQLPKTDFEVSDYLEPGQFEIKSVILETKVFQFSPLKNFGDEYANQIASGSNNKILLNANVVNIQTDVDGRSVKQVELSTFNRKSIKVSAKIFILAAGGIENPRLLLASNKVQKNGLGNQNDLVGRFFNEHPHLFIAELSHGDPHIFRGIYSAMDYTSNISRIPCTCAIGLKEKALRENQLLNGCAVLVERPRYKLEPVYNSRAGVGFTRLAEVLTHDRCLKDSLMKDLNNCLSDPIAVFRILKRQAQKVLSPDRCVSLRIMVETEPNPDSRITLSERKDAFGVPRIELDWRLTSRDQENFKRFKEIVFSELRLLGFGVNEIDHELDDEGWPLGMTAAKHHSGTTRMHQNPKYGVVDANSKVHGISNLYVAGNSVFPTSGFSNPTFTILALALRLADHIKDVMKKM